jgi:hypothetical protein
MKCRLLSLALLVLAAALVAACATSHSPKTEARAASGTLGFNFILRRLAGPTAINCGTAAIDADRSPVDTCVVSAFRANRPFFAVYDEFHEGIEDSAGANGFLSTEAGVIFFLRWESAPYAHYGHPPAETLESWPCSQPRIVSSARGTETLACW